MENENYFDSFVESFINGNLSYCQKECDKYNRIDLRNHFIDYAGFSHKKATLAIDYLYDGGSFQAYADCE